MVVFRLAEGKTQSEKGLDGSGGISRHATLRLRWEKDSQRPLDSHRSLRNGELSEVKSAVGQADELLVSSSLECTSSRPAACKYWLPPFPHFPLRPSFLPYSSSDPFPSPATGLFFFLPYYFRQCSTDDDDDDFEGENSRLKLHFRNATTTASFIIKRYHFHSKEGI